MNETKHIGIIGNDGVGLAIAHVMAEEHKPIILVGQGQVGKTMFAQQLMENIPTDYEIKPIEFMPPKIQLEEPKTGRENRRERRKQERKNKL